MPALSCIKLSKFEQQQLKELVWQVISNGVDGQEFSAAAAPKSINLLTVTACFVTLYIDGKLRGCTGSCVGELPLWLAASEYGFCSAFEDNRFAPVAAHELSNLTITISILSPLQSIKNNGEQQVRAALEVNVDGLMLAQHHQTAVFLPNVWQSLPTAERFLSALKRKGGWPDDYWSSDIDLYRFHTDAF